MKHHLLILTCFFWMAAISQSDTALVSNDTGVTFVIDSTISAGQYKSGDTTGLFTIASDVLAYDRTGHRVVVFKKGAAVIDTVVSAIPTYTVKNKSRGAISHSAGLWTDSKENTICEFVIEFLAATAVDGSRVLLEGCQLVRKCVQMNGITNGDASNIVAGSMKSCQIRWPGAKIAVSPSK